MGLGKAFILCLNCLGTPTKFLVFKKLLNPQYCGQRGLSFHNRMQCYNLKLYMNVCLYRRQNKAKLLFCNVHDINLSSFQSYMGHDILTILFSRTKTHIAGLSLPIILFIYKFSLHKESVQKTYNPKYTQSKIA